MRYDPTQLETLRLIADEGSFEAAARKLHLTPSAVSQRVRALEASAGQVLVRRTSPAEVTAAGEPLLRLARQLHLLAAEAETLLTAGGVLELTVAINADSLATWFRRVLSQVAQRPGTVLRLQVEDESYSHELLRRGEVLAAITSEPTPVQGCSVEHLGNLPYQPAAAPGLLERHRKGRSVDWGAMPMVVFNEKDQLQDAVLATRGAQRPAVVHRVPTSADFLAAISAGMGWGMVPVPQFVPDELVRIPGARPLSVPLYWQRWRLESPGLELLTADVRAAGRNMLAAV